MTRGRSNVKLMLSTSSFWFWRQAYDPIENLRIIQDLDLNMDGVDIWLFPDQEPFRVGKPLRSYICSFNWASLHTDFYTFDWEEEMRRKDVEEFDKQLRMIADVAAELGIGDVVIHSDFLVANRQKSVALIHRELAGLRVSVEGMDKNKTYGTHPEHFRDIFSVAHDFGFVPDIAHLLDFSDEYGWEELLLAPDLRDRCRFVHVSLHDAALSGNFYARQGFNDINAIHAFCIAEEDLLPDGLIAACKEFPMIIEGIVPPGRRGVELLEMEMEFLRNAGGVL